jgi:DNA-binding response OmpR family regulator
MRILIIEDNRGIRNFLSQGFRYKNYICDEAINGKEGLKKILSNNYDLAIVDLMLPELNGEKVIDQARQIGIMIPIIVLTVVQDLQTKTRLLEMGVDDFVEKPFSFEELYARVNAILRRHKRTEVTEYLKISDLELVPEKRLAKRADKTIPLRGKEYALLEYLMRNKDKVVSRNTLMENVWGYNTACTSNTVDSHISSLRHKVDEWFATKLIKTVHGIGYMLSESDR